MQKTRGFSSLILVLIIGSASLLMAKGAVWLGLREMEMTSNTLHSSKTFYLAEACVADALIRLKKDNNFLTESSSLSLSNCNCNYSLSGDEYTRSIVSTASCNNFFSTIKLTVSLGEKINITAWSRK